MPLPIDNVAPLHLMTVGMWIEFSNTSNSTPSMIPMLLSLELHLYPIGIDTTVYLPLMAVARYVRFLSSAIVTELPFPKPYLRLI